MKTAITCLLHRATILPELSDTEKSAKKKKKLMKSQSRAWVLLETSSQANDPYVKMCNHERLELVR